MSRSIANLVISSDTFGSWVSKSNEMSFAFSETVTVKANTAGDSTTGNGFVVGIFGANTITATAIRGGNVSTSASISITTNTALGNSSSQVIVTHNETGQVKTSSYTTTNTDVQIMDTFAVADFRAGKYLISIKNTNNNDYQSTEIMLLQTGTDASLTEYATLTSSSTLAQFTANVDAGTVRLWVTPSLANNVLKYQRTLLAV